MLELLELALIVFGVPAIPLLIFAVPLTYGDKISKGMLDDLSSSPVDYME